MSFKQKISRFSLDQTLFGQSTNFPSYLVELTIILVGRISNLFQRQSYLPEGLRKVTQNRLTKTSMRTRRKQNVENDGRVWCENVYTDDWMPYDAKNVWNKKSTTKLQ